MILTAKKFKLLQNPTINLLYEHSDDKLLIFQRAGLLFAFNFHPQRSYPDYRIEAPAGTYKLILDSDAPQYGGHSRLVAGQQHLTFCDQDADRKVNFLSLYLPSRTALVFQRII
jgi:1,4-alpha-glucan branching enzyme